MLKLNAKKRELFGKKLQASRKEGMLPAVLYGGKEENSPIFVNLKEFKKVWAAAGDSSIIELNIGSKIANVLVQDVTWEPVKDKLIHVDFLAVEMDKEITTTVALVFVGVSPAIKDLGGVLVKVMREVEVVALPKNLPHEIEVDISGLVNFESQITVGDLKLPNGVKATTKEEEVVVLSSAPHDEEAVESAETPSIEDIQVEKKGKAEEAIDEDTEKK